MKFGLLIHDPSKDSVEVAIRPGKIINSTAKRPRFFENDSSQWWGNNQMPLKDSYVNRVYAAEQMFADRVEQHKFLNITEAAKYLRSFMEKAWFQRRFPKFRTCKIQFRTGARTCTGGASELAQNGEPCSGRIQLTNWGLGVSKGRGGEIVLLHELAHCVLPCSHLHDRRWVRTYAEFIGCAMGQDIKRILIDELKNQNIPMSPVRAFNGT